MTVTVGQDFNYFGYTIIIIFNDDIIKSVRVEALASGYQTKNILSEVLRVIRNCFTKKRHLD